MKITMLSTMYLRYPTDTRGLMVAEFNRLLKKQGHQIEVIAPGDETTKSVETIDGIKIHRFTYFLPKKLQKIAYGSGIPTNLRRSWLAKFQVPLFAISFFLKTLKHTKNSDILHCQWLPPAVIALMVKKFRKKPVVVTVRRVSTQKMLIPFYKYALKNADLVLFNSKWMQDQSLKLATPKQYRVFNNSLDTKKFSPMPKEEIEKIRKENNIPKNAKILLFLGHLIEKKGVEYLIEAFPAILKSHPDTFLFIGGYGPREQALKELTKRFKVEDKVLFTGKLEADITPLYFNLADIFVLPSIIDSKGDTETLGVVAMEALSCETPVICSKVGGLPDVVTSKVGILVKSKDPFELHKAICDLLADDKKRHSLGKEGRMRIIEKFGDKAALNNLKECYNLIKDGRN